MTTLQKDGTSPGRNYGDKSLEESLMIVAKSAEGFANEQGSTWPYMTVGGLDLSMGQDVSNSRISKVESHFFKTDRTNTQHTIIDGNDFVRRKYDFTVAKMDICVEARLQNISITDERYAWGLDKHITKVSDHLPVISTVKTVRKSWFSIPFIS